MREGIESLKTWAILPMKSPDKGKTRLSGEIEDGVRRALAWAMYSDVLIALGRTSSVETTIVVTPDVEAARVAALHGAGFIDDDSSSGHSDAAAIGMAHAAQEGAERVVLIPGDCPSLDPAELDQLLAEKIDHPSCLIVPDRHGTGTNALVISPADGFEPAFGDGSHARHLERAAEGSIEARSVPVASLAFDVDTREDLIALIDRLDQTRGTAAHTRGLIKQLGRASLGI
jgi:2-phospho-L-lactate/phosphoenolpyruvate guanylyltransferase